MDSAARSTSSNLENNCSETLFIPSFCYIFSSENDASMPDYLHPDYEEAIQYDYGDFDLHTDYYGYGDPYEDEYSNATRKRRKRSTTSYHNVSEFFTKDGLFRANSANVRNGLTVYAHVDKKAYNEYSDNDFFGFKVAAILPILTLHQCV